MKAVVVTAPGKFQVMDNVPAPQLTEYEALVRIRACGFCNCSDMEMINDTHVNVVFQYPFVLGHEGAGEIVECGAKVKNFAVGDHIVFPLGKPGNGNPADTGFYTNAGHYAEYGVVRDLASMRDDEIDVRAMEKELDGFARKIPLSIPLEDAGVIVPMRETLSAARNVGITKGSKVLLYGDGPNGFGFATFAKYLGAEWIGLVGHNEKRMDHFRKHTAVDLYINSHTQDVAEELRRAGITPDIAVDGVGRHAIMIEASGLVRRGGKVVLYAGVGPEQHLLDLHEFKNNVVLHKHFFPDGDLDVNDELCELIVSGKVDPKNFYSHTVPIDDFQQAIDKTLSREAFKVVVTI